MPQFQLIPIPCSHADVYLQDVNKKQSSGGMSVAPCFGEYVESVERIYITHYITHFLGFSFLSRAIEKVIMFEQHWPVVGPAQVCAQADHS